MLYKKIESGKIMFPSRQKYRIAYSDNIMDLIVKLLERDVTKRLGSQNDAEEILQHPCFE